MQLADGRRLDAAQNIDNYLRLSSVTGSSPPNRTEIIWTRDDIDLFNQHAPKWVQRMLMAGCETGLRSADLIQVKMCHFEETPHGKRLRFRTRKRGQIAYIPAVQTLESSRIGTPDGQETLLVSRLSKPLSARWVSNQITKWRRTEYQLRALSDRAATNFRFPPFLLKNYSLIEA